jgi:transcriptional regulator with XRE-family HTH domain
MAQFPPFEPEPPLLISYSSFKIVVLRAKFGSAKDTYLAHVYFFNTYFSCCQQLLLIFVYPVGMGFGENLKQELAYNGMLKKELAALSGVHKRAIDTYVRTKASMPPADAAVKIAKALGVTVEYLVTGEDSSMLKETSRMTRSIQNLNQRDRKLVASLVKLMSEL